MAITTNNLISKQTVGSAGAASVTFSNIPQGFTDLLIKESSRDSDTSGALTTVSFNGLTSNLSSIRLRGTGTTATSSTFASFIYTQGQANGDTANTFANSEIYIPNYTSSNYKSVSGDGVSENNATAAYMQLTTGLWSSTAAITSVTLTSAAGPYLQYSTFSLYGISSNTTTQNTSVPSATGGDVIATDGTYWYHAFKYSGTFTPLKALTADYLVVAGGGGAASSGSGSDSGTGGGGAGGFRTATSQSLATGNYTVTIGAGGAGGVGDGIIGAKGNNSSINSFAATGGGYSQASAGTGTTGGSGSGASFANGTAGTGNQGSYSPVEGYNGGRGYTDFVVGNGSGGGGGAGAVGNNGTVSTYQGADGGIGNYSAISGGANTAVGILSGGNYYFAGGGGGAAGRNNGTYMGIGGIGGGGASPGTSGTANTGGGGGGRPGWNAQAVSPGGSGGSGIVIVRYAV